MTDFTAMTARLASDPTASPTIGLDLGAGLGAGKLSDENMGGKEVARLRLSAEALGVAWPAQTVLRDVEKLLTPDDERHAALMMRSGMQARALPMPLSGWNRGLARSHGGDLRPCDRATAPAGRLLCATRHLGDREGRTSAGGRQ